MKESEKENTSPVPFTDESTNILIKALSLVRQAQADLIHYRNRVKNSQSELELLRHQNEELRKVLSRLKKMVGDKL